MPGLGNPFRMERSNESSKSLEVARRDIQAVAVDGETKDLSFVARYWRTRGTWLKESSSDGGGVLLRLERHGFPRGAWAYATLRLTPTSAGRTQVTVVGTVPAQHWAPALGLLLLCWLSGMRKQSWQWTDTSAWLTLVLGGIGALFAYAYWRNLGGLVRDGAEAAGVDP